MASTGLMCEAEEFSRRVQALEQVGVSEIACLVDIGLPPDLARENLDRLIEAAETA